jgi:hypothetical protein
MTRSGAGGMKSMATATDIPPQRLLVRVACPFCLKEQGRLNHPIKARVCVRHKREIRAQGMLGVVLIEAFEEMEGGRDERDEVSPELAHRSGL